MSDREKNIQERELKKKNVQKHMRIRQKREIPKKKKKKQRKQKEKGNKCDRNELV